MSKKVFKVPGEDKSMFNMLPAEHNKLLNYVLESNKKAGEIGRRL